MPETSKHILSKILLVVEAFFGGFYVSITRGLFVPMMVYSGYNLDMVSMALLPTGLGGLLLAHTLYKRPEAATSRFRIMLLSTHFFERVLWLLPPFFLYNPYLLSLNYLAGNLVAVMVGLLIGVLIYSIFSIDDVIEVSVHRSAAGAAASILGSSFMTYLSAVQKAPGIYYVLYITAFLAGLVSTGSLLLLPNVPGKIKEERVEKKLEEEAKIKGSVVFLVLTLFMAGGNLVGMAWSPLLRQLGAPLYIPLALTFAGNIGGLIGAYLWRSYRAYLVAIALNSLLTGLIPYIWFPPIHVGMSFLTSLTFMGANLLGMQVFAEINNKLGRVRAAAFLTGANYAGLLLASSTLALGIFTPFVSMLLAALLKMIGVIMAMLVIPETAVVPERRAYEYSRLIYSTSTMGYTFTVQASKEFLKFAVETLALALLLTLLYVMYRLSWMIAGI
jgi:hypothetical protein